MTCVIPLEVLAAQFDAENADQEFDQARISASLMCVSVDSSCADRVSYLGTAAFFGQASTTREPRPTRETTSRHATLRHTRAGRVEDFLDQVAALSYYLYGVCREAAGRGAGGRCQSPGGVVG